MLRPSARLAGPPKLADRHGLDHCKQAVFVIRMGVAEQQAVNPLDAQSLQGGQGGHRTDPPAVCLLTATVHKPRGTVVELQQGRVPVTDIQERHPQRAALGHGRPPIEPP